VLPSKDTEHTWEAKTGQTAQLGNYAKKLVIDMQYIRELIHDMRYAWQSFRYVRQHLRRGGNPDESSF